MLTGKEQSDQDFKFSENNLHANIYELTICAHFLNYITYGNFSNVPIFHLSYSSPDADISQCLFSLFYTNWLIPYAGRVLNCL